MSSEKMEYTLHLKKCRCGKMPTLITGQARIGNSSIDEYYIGCECGMRTRAYAMESFKEILMSLEKIWNGETE